MKKPKTSDSFLLFLLLIGLICLLLGRIEYAVYLNTLVIALGSLSFIRNR